MCPLRSDFHHPARLCREGEATTPRKRPLRVPTSVDKRPHTDPDPKRGEVPERSNGAVSKTVVGASPPRVRIPVSPPFYPSKPLFLLIYLFSEPPKYPPPCTGLPWNSGFWVSCACERGKAVALFRKRTCAMVRVPVRVRLRLFFCIPHPHKAPLGRAIGSGADCIARTRVTISRKDPRNPSGRHVR